MYCGGVLLLGLYCTNKVIVDNALEIGQVVNDEDGGCKDPWYNG